MAGNVNDTKHPTWFYSRALFIMAETPIRISQIPLRNKAVVNSTIGFNSEISSYTSIARIPIRIMVK